MLPLLLERHVEFEINITPKESHQDEKLLGGVNGGVLGNCGILYSLGIPMNSVSTNAPVFM